MHRLFLIASILVAALVLMASTSIAQRPNVVVMMVDDMGYSDLGCYGGEIETPNLDALATGGVRFSQFYNTAKCHSSRVSLLTGQYCIAAGDTSLSHAVTTAEVLRSGGYFTAMAGKWHLDQQPTDFGFDRYFGHLSGACNYFSGDKTFRLNGEAWAVPEQGFYTTVANVDYALNFLDEARETARPWYLYIAFNAPHAPLHALPEDYAKYKGKYEDGWDNVRGARVAKQQRIGLLAESLVPSPRPEHVPAWSDIEKWRQDYEANRMSTLAAMIDRIDQEVGRLVADLKANNELDNTIILFVSDNGACPYDRSAPRLDVEPTNAQTSLADSTGWSWARNSPFRYYKQNQFEGGISTPAILHWPAGLKQTKGSVIHEPAHLIDVLPTLAEITECEIPDQWEGRELRPISGVSLKPVIDGGKLGQRPPIHFLFSNDRGLRDGDWKLVSFQGKAWELYNVAEDRTELHNLASAMPDRLQSMVAKWTEMTKDVLKAPAKTFAPVSEALPPHLHHEWTKFDSQEKKANSGKRKSRKPQVNSSIRARKNTKLAIADDELRLEFTGDDPGLAFDLRKRNLVHGPYRLKFALTGGSTDGGEVFYTTEPNTTLPDGDRVTFEVHADGNSHEVVVDLPTNKSLQQLRLDVSEAAGSATIRNLTLSSQDDRVLIRWPEK